MNYKILNMHNTNYITYIWPSGNFSTSRGKSLFFSLKEARIAIKRRHLRSLTFNYRIIPDDEK